MPSPPTAPATVTEPIAVSELLWFTRNASTLPFAPAWEVSRRFSWSACTANCEMVLLPAFTPVNASAMAVATVGGLDAAQHLSEIPAIAAHAITRPKSGLRWESP
jgi:hypothetical protein